MDLDKLLEVAMENPEMATLLLSSMIEKYKKPVYDVCGEFVKIVQDYSNAYEWFEVNARIKKQQFDAYVKVGFTSEQAMAFLLQDNRDLAKQIGQVSKNVKVKTEK